MSTKEEFEAAIDRIDGTKALFEREEVVAAIRAHVEELEAENARLRDELKYANKDKPKPKWMKD